MRLLLVVLALTFGLWAEPATAEKYAPLGAAPSGAQEAPVEAREPGVWTAVGGWLIRFNRTVNKEVQRHMTAVRDDGTLGPLLLALAAAFGYGALHVAGPGHGKVVVASYFLSRDASIGRGMLMGGRIALVHVIAAVVVVILADLLLRATLGTAPGGVPGVRLVSYGAIATIGLWMLVQSVRRSMGLAAPHAHGDACAHGHGHGRTEGLLALGVGLVPCTGAVLIMLYAIANNILLAGVLLVAAISLGMALTLSAIGLASIWARRTVSTRLEGRDGRPPLAITAMEYVGAVLIAGFGAALFAGEALGVFSLPGA